MITTTIVVVILLVITSFLVYLVLRRHGINVRFPRVTRKVIVTTLIILVALVAIGIIMKSCSADDIRAPEIPPPPSLPSPPAKPSKSITRTPISIDTSWSGWVKTPRGCLMNWDIDRGSYEVMDAKGGVTIFPATRPGIVADTIRIPTDLDSVQFRTQKGSGTLTLTRECS